MNQRVLIVFVGLLVLGIGFLGSAESKSLTWTSTFTIPPTLELHTGSKQPILKLEASAGDLVKAKLTLRVGTNDWPLNLHLGLVLDGIAEPEFDLFYQFVRGDELSPLWVLLPVFSNGNPVAQLPYPAWTDYSLAIRMNLPDSTAQGTYHYKLCLLLHSRSGLVKSLDIPVEVVVR